MQNQLTLNNQQLLQQIHQLVGRQRDCIASLIIHLKELDSRKLHLELGYSGMFSFLNKKLLFAEATAWRYQQSVKVFDVFPEIVTHIRSGQLNLTIIAGAAKQLLDQGQPIDQRSKLLQQLMGKSKAETAGLLAKKTDHLQRETVQTFIIEEDDEPVKKESTANELMKKTVGNNNGQNNTHKLDQTTPPSTDTITKPENQKPSDQQPVEPKTKTVKKLSITVSEEMYQDILKAKALLSTKKPGGVKIVDVFEESLQLFLDKKCPQRREERRQKKESSKPGPIDKPAQVEPPSPVSKPSQKDSASSRSNKPNGPESVAKNKDLAPKRTYLPMEVRQEVLKRSNYECSYVGSDGVCCQSKHNLHIDHIIPLAQGGDNDVNNLRMLCSLHNLLEAQRMMGKPFIERKIKQAQIMNHRNEVSPPVQSTTEYQKRMRS